MKNIAQTEICRLNVTIGSHCLNETVLASLTRNLQFGENESTSSGRSNLDDEFWSK